MLELNQVYNMDCLEGMAQIPDNSIDAVITDPPYGLKFMGQNWDNGIPGVPYWAEALRVAKPGTHLLSFGGTRTFHRLAVAIEDAGWEIRDTVMWVYGSGFPKSHNMKGEWEGWGTALKPAWEPIIVARKPLEGTVAENVQEWGVGAINIDGCRVRVDGNDSNARKNKAGGCEYFMNGDKRQNAPWGIPESGSAGRWPANLIHDGSDEVVGLFPATKSGKLNEGHKQGQGMMGKIGGDTILRDYGGDSGSAARFFYCAKASKADRDGSTHPTMKPTALMQYLCRLVTPPGGVILDPFAGSGSTGKAAKIEVFNYILIEKESVYVEISRKRLNTMQNNLFNRR